MIRGPEVGEIIKFPVWIIPFPVLKINFELLGMNEKHFVKEVFWSQAWNRINNSISFLENSISCLENQFVSTRKIENSLLWVSLWVRQIMGWKNEKEKKQWKYRSTFVNACIWNTIGFQCLFVLKFFKSIKQDLVFSVKLQFN